MGNDDLHIKTEMRDEFIVIHEMHLRARASRLRAHAYSILEDAAWTDATIAWTRAMQSGDDIPKIATQGKAWIEKLQKAKNYHAKKESEIKASRRCEKILDAASPNEIWTDGTVNEYRAKFGEKFPIADKIMRRITSLMGEREAIRAMEKMGDGNGIRETFDMDASDAIKHIETELASLMDGLSTLKNGGADDGKSK